MIILHECAIDTGANASAEEAEEPLEAGESRMNLEDTSFGGIARINNINWAQDEPPSSPAFCVRASFSDSAGLPPRRECGRPK